MEGKGKNPAGFTHSDISGIVQGAFGDKQILQSSILSVIWVSGTLLGTVGGGEAYRCARDAFDPGEKRHVNK